MEKKVSKFRRNFVIILLVLATSLLLLFLITAFNPMQFAFLAPFDIVNSGEEYIEVVPIGMLAGSGRYAPLPRYRNVFPPAIPLLISRPISLPPGTKKKVTYDCDDINFRHILVKNKSGNIYVLDTDKKGTKQYCYGPQKDLYIIPPIIQLQRAPSELIQCFYGHRISYSDAKEYP